MREQIKEALPYPIRRSLRALKRKANFLSLERVLPAPVRRVWHQRRELNDSETLANVERTLKEKYGPELVTVIADRDEMFSPIPGVAGGRVAVAKAGYLMQGDSMVRTLEEVLHTVGRSLDDVDSLLDFACGYGRCARYLVQRLGRDKVTVSDICQEAVDFNRKMLGVRGFASVSRPEALVHEGRYDVIFVASLFSHLCHGDWLAWLKRLGEMLTTNGLLVVSTHGHHAYNILDKEVQGLFQHQEPGFYFSHCNETHGRLAAEQYGSAYVTEEYVRRVVAQEQHLRLVAFFPRKLCNYQDIYIIKRTDGGH
jgi:2-polyprenyl-3-methyl-5-hydroxy-6-metoxy-1,4-benzoquinol methylase